MVSQVLRQSLRFLFTHPGIVRAAFWLGGLMNLYVIISISMRTNNILHESYGLTGDTMGYINYVISFLLSYGFGWVLFVGAILLFIGYVLLYPLSTAMMIYYADTGQSQRSKSFGRYFGVVILESSLGFATLGSWHFQLLAWLYIMDIYTNPAVLILLSIIGTIVLGCTLLFPFSEYFMLLHHDGSDDPQNEARNAMGQSANLVIDNLSTTIWYSLFHLLVRMRYVFNIALVVGLPLAISYLLLSYDVISQDVAMWIVLGIGCILMWLVVYTDSLIDALFMVYRYTLFKKLTGEDLPAHMQEKIEEKTAEAESVVEEKNLPDEKNIVAETEDLSMAESVNLEKDEEKISS